MVPCPAQCLAGSSRWGDCSSLTAVMGSRTELLAACWCLKDTVGELESGRGCKFMQVDSHPAEGRAWLLVESGHLV